MTARFATGKYALGMCDRCGCRAMLNSLKTEVIARQQQNLRVCSDCWDPDHPQLSLGLVDKTDPQSLENARPDTGLAASREIPS